MREICRQFAGRYREWRHKTMRARGWEIVDAIAARLSAMNTE